MRLSLFLIGAIVLTIFAIVGATNTPSAASVVDRLCFGVQSYVWLLGAFLSYLVDIAVGGWAPWGPRATVVQAPPQ